MILLTGATGFVGSCLLRELLRLNKDVCCLCRNISNYERVKDILNKCIWYNMDNGCLEDIFKNNEVEIVIHCATAYGRSGQDIFDVFNTNVEMPIKLYQCAVEYGTKLFINTDSFFTEALNGTWTSGHRVYLDNYTKTKFVFREFIKCNIEKFDICFVNMRLEHVYGPGDSQDKFVGYFIKNLKCGVTQIELSEGSQTRDWIWIDDVVSAYITVISKYRLLKMGQFYEYQVGTGESYSLKKFCELVKDISKSPTCLMFGKREMDSRELKSSVANNTSLKELGWCPKVTLEEGIRRLVSK